MHSIKSNKKRGQNVIVGCVEDVKFILLRLSSWLVFTRSLSCVLHNSPLRNEQLLVKHSKLFLALVIIFKFHSASNALSYANIRILELADETMVNFFLSKLHEPSRLIFRAILKQSLY